MDCLRENILNTWKVLSVDKNRILAKLDEIERYIDELIEIKPKSFKEYQASIKEKRASERLVQIAIESVLDICSIIVSDMKLGLPEDEDDVIKKLETSKVIKNELALVLSKMKGMRNILVHKYGEVEDELVFESISQELEDFDKFKEEILRLIEKN